MNVCNLFLCTNNCMGFYMIKKFKKFYKLILIITFILIYTSAIFTLSATGITPGNNDNPNDIVEVKDNYWTHDCVISLLRAQIITGYDDGSVKLEGSITREEVAAVIAKSMLYKNININSLPENYKFIYTDKISNWALEYVNLTTFNKIYSGYSDNTFKGNKNITREEAAKVIAIAFNKTLSNDFELTFNDKGEISNWSLQYVKTLVKYNVINGYTDNEFKPQNDITRAEFFSIICNELELHN